MTARQQRFIAELLVDGNAAAAARRAGYSERTARQIANELLTKPDIRAAVEEARARQLERVAADAQAKAQRVLLELERVAYSDVRTIFADGRILPPHLWSDDTAAAISAIEVAPKTGLRVRRWNKVAALVELRRHYWPERVEAKVMVNDEAQPDMALRQLPQAKLDRLIVLTDAALIGVPLNQVEQAERRALADEAFAPPQQQQQRNHAIAPVIDIEELRGRRRRAG
jgi:phage terminase small subunit